MAAPIPLHDDSKIPRIPWVTWGIIVANIVVFLLLQPPFDQQGFLDGIPLVPSLDLDDAREEFDESFEFTVTYGAIPCELDEMRAIADGARCDAASLEELQAELASVDADLPDDKNVPFSLLSSMFLHGGILHIVGNMAFLWVFGRAVEARLGHVLFLLLYLVTGVAAVAAFAVFNMGDAVPLVGASGAISGVLGAYVVFNRRSRILMYMPTGCLLQAVYVPALIVLGIYFLSQFLVYGLAEVLVPEAALNVAWEAHVGGMVAGVVLALPGARRLGPGAALPEVPAPFSGTATGQGGW
ncbi:MAG: rhomboid family intramembrane serine protease [Acidimicrobiales bacterium]